MIALAGITGGSHGIHGTERTVAAIPGLRPLVSVPFSAMRTGKLWDMSPRLPTLATTPLIRVPLPDASTSTR